MLDALFIRVGKTGSSSVSKALTQHFGEAHTHFDVSPHFAQPERRERFRGSGKERLARLAEVKFVHGHVPASDYDGVPVKARITFLRDPLTRLLSHYSYWLAEVSGALDPEQTILRDQQLSILAFAARPRVRQLCTEHYFGGCDMRSFDFIGCFERFDEDFTRAMDIVGASVPVRHDLPNPDPQYEQRKAEVAADKQLAASLCDLLAAEYEFYHRWTGR